MLSNFCDGWGIFELKPGGRWSSMSHKDRKYCTRARLSKKIDAAGLMGRNPG